MKVIAFVAAAALAACNQNTELGNDREGQIDPAPTPAPVIRAAAALANVATEVIKPETMSDTDIAALGGKEVGFPSFLFEPGGGGTIKLNGKLIPLPATGERRYEDGGLLVTLRPVDETGNAGLKAMEMIIVPPGAKDEIGYRGYVQCFGNMGDEA
jgi:hypothetical protein